MTQRLERRAMCDTCGMIRGYRGPSAMPSLKCASCDGRRWHHVVGELYLADQMAQRENEYNRAALAEVAHLRVQLGKLGIRILNAKPTVLDPID